MLWLHGSKENIFTMSEKDIVTARLKDILTPVMNRYLACMGA